MSHSNELADPNQIEAYRTAREYQRVVQRFIETLPKRKGLTIAKLMVHVEQLPKQVLDCVSETNDEMLKWAVRSGLRSCKRAHGIIDRFDMIHMGDRALRLAALEIAERVKAAFLEFRR